MNYRTRDPMINADFARGQAPFQSTGDISLSSAITDSIFSLPGDFLYVDQASTGFVSIELNAEQGGTLAPVLLGAGGKIECPFKSFKITAAAQLGKTVRILVGNGARISGGANVNASSLVVTAVDGAKVRSDQGNAFIGYGGKAAVAAQYAHFQLFNPVASTKTVYVERVKVLQGASQTIGICSYSTALSGNAGGAPNKKIGGAVSTAQMRSQANATSLITDYLGIMATTASLSDAFTPIEPYALTPGKGILMVSQSVNTDVYGIFEFFEE